MLFNLQIPAEYIPAPINISLTGAGSLPFSQGGLTGNRLQFIDGDGLVREITGKIINSLTLNSTTVWKSRPTSVDFNDIAGVEAGINVISGTNLTSIIGNSVAFVGGGLTLFNTTTGIIVGGVNQSIGSSLTTISFPELLYINGSLAINNSTDRLPLLTTLNFNKLEFASTLGINYLNANVPLNLPAFKAVIFSSTVSNIQSNSINLSEFTCAGSNLTISGCPNITSLNLSKLKYIGGTLTITNNTSLANLDISGLQYYIGSTASFANNALNQASIDSILAVFASYDGTSGTAFGTGRTLTLTGGTNATPSAAGLASKAIITGRGATVTHN